ncbi:phage tail tape measure protein [Staphylococcus hominis]|uniref:phage tail tape measure protein n=2 Tax=Staphylococcus TaxID=1279 RepID=UPI001643E368|nr:phage tail tape measure protein [Staphylococcus hominis]
MAERIKGLQIDLSMKDMGVQRSISEIKRSFKGLNADLKLSNNNFKYSEKSLNSYKLRTRELSQAVKESKANVAALKAKYQEVSRESGVNSKKAAQLRQEYSRQADNLNYLQNELDQTRDKYREMIAVSKSSVGRLGQTFSAIGPKIRSIGDSMKSVGRSMTLNVTAPIAAGFGVAMKKSIDFDDTMRKVKATSGATGNEFNQLRTKALQMGRDTKFTASESAEAMNYMALAGWDTKDMLNGIGGVMNLAAASGEDLASVSDIVTDNLTAFGMKAKDSTHFADVLAQTSSKANTDVRGLGEAFKYAAPVAGALGYSVEDTSIAIGLMSNAGIKGEKAGTALRTMFTNLAKPTKAMKEEMDRLGISITDSNGEMLPMRDVLDQLRTKMGGLSKDQQAAAASTIFGKEAMSGALAVINASDEDYKKLTKSIDGSSGAAKRMANEMEGGIGGAMRKMKSAIESLAISLGDALAPMLYKVATWVTKLATKFSNLPSGVQKTITVVGLLAAAIGPLVLVMGMFTSAIGSIATTLGPVMVSIAKAGGLMSFLSGKASIAAKGLSMLGGASGLLLNPVGLVVAGIAALGTAFVIAYKKSETFRNVVNGVLEAIKNSFVILWNVLKPIMAAIWDIIKTVFQQINDAGNEIIQMLSEQFGPAFNDVGNIVKSLQPVFETVMHAIKSVVDFVMPGIKAMFQNTFNGIKNIVTGALDIILGVVKIFVSLFTGNFKLMWSGVKQIFSGFIKIIVGIFKVSFVGQIIAFAKGMWTKVKQIFLNLWKDTKAIFSTLGVWIGKKWQEIKNSVVDKAKRLWSGVKAIWNFLKTGTIKIMASIAVWLIKKWTAIKKSVVNKAKALWSGVKDAWNALKSGTIKIIASVAVWLIKKWLSIKNNVVNTVKKLWSGVKKTWNSLKKGTIKIIASVAVWLIKKWSSIKDSVVNKAKALWAGVKKAWNNLKNGTTKIFKAVGSFMSSKWSSIKSGTVNKAKALWSGVKGAWSSLSKGTHRTMNAVGGFMDKKWKSIKNGTVNLVTGMKNKVTSVMNKMSDVIRSVTGKIKSLFGNMTKGVETGLNALIKGVNWVGDKLSMKKLPEVKLHTGTESTHTQSFVTNGKLNRDTFATVGDKGRGNGPGGFRHETIIPPKGKPFITPSKDTTMPLSKGTRILNGAQTHSLLSKPQFNSGTIPKFSLGTTFAKLLGGGKKPKKHKKDDDLVGDVAQKTKDGVKAMTGKVVEGGKAVVDSALNTAKKGKDWLSDKIGDVLDWIEKPKKLLEKVFEGFGINMASFGIPEGAKLPFDLMKGMFSKLKEATVDKIKEWFEESSAGDGGYIDLSKGVNFGFAPTAAAARAQGYPFARPHHGLDINYKYDKVYSTLAGKATGSTGWNGGFGRNMWIRTKNGIEAIYGHLSKLAFSGTRQVKPGDYLGVSGGDPSRDGVNAGSSTGPHLHYEMRWNGQPKDPTNWLKKNNGGGKSGGSKAANKWKPEIKQALKANGLPTTSAYVNAWIRQIQTESGGNAGAVQGNIGDINNRTGNLARGLLQVIPPTFAANKLPGHGNIMNGLDNAMAAMNYAKKRYGKSGMLQVIGHGHGYATGGLIKSAGWYNIAEGGYPEWVIPTDPSRNSDAMKLLALAAKDIESKNKRNKRPSNFSNTKISSSQSDNSKLEQKLDMLIGLMSKLVQSNDTIANKDFEVSLDGKELSRNNSKQQALKVATQLMRG